MLYPLSYEGLACTFAQRAGRVAVGCVRAGYPSPTSYAASVPRAVGQLLTTAPNTALIVRLVLILGLPSSHATMEGDRAASRGSPRRNRHGCGPIFVVSGRVWLFTASRAQYAPQPPVTVRASILVVGSVARCDSVVISSRHGSSLPGEGRGARYAVQPCTPPLGLAAVSACREEITTGPQPHLRSGAGFGRSPSSLRCRDPWSDRMTRRDRNTASQSGDLVVMSWMTATSVTWLVMLL
jgi:hypothetical protein